MDLGRVEEGVKRDRWVGNLEGGVPCTISISQLVQRCVTTVLHHGVGKLFLGVDALLGYHDVRVYNYTYSTKSSKFVYQVCNYRVLASGYWSDWAETGM